MKPETKVDPKEAAELKKMVKYLNGSKVTKKDFIKVIEECERRHEGDWEPGDGMFVIAMMFRKTARKCQAIYFRIDAMNDLLIAGAIPDYWAMPKNEDRAIAIREGVLLAAAREPLIALNNEIAFDRDKFVKRCLTLEEAKGLKQ